MSRYRQRWEESASSHSGSRGHSGRSYYSDDYGWGHYTPTPFREGIPTRSFNYWREEAQLSYRRENHDERWRDDGGHSRYAHPRRWRDRDSGPRRDWDDMEPRRDRSLSYGGPSRQHYSTHTSAPYIHPPTFRAKSPMDPMPPTSKPASQPPRRKVPPSPKKSSETPQPSSNYLSLSQAPSEPLNDPERVRKLLILDLNGTLLIRSPRPRVPSKRQLRPVQPRPYMQSFRQYLFCPGTKAWLDTMVWSSAQPHSVDDMVDKVFGAEKAELRATWNRKSLGLSEAEYHQKTVTQKDLEKAWDLFATVEDRSTGSLRSQSVHSALTTLLLDDSPHKAALQPYNHVCISEYDTARRQRDLRSFQATKGSKEGRQSKKTMQRNQVETTARSICHMAISDGGTLRESTGEEPYDVLLLAVVGVLEAVKVQSNVAGWIRRGGLWVTSEDAGSSDIGRVDARDGKAAPDVIVSAGNDKSSTSDAITSEQARLQTGMWFDDSTVLAYWVARGKKALMDLGIQVIHGVTG